MSRVITFARQFPSYHPRKGEPTRFIEKIYAGLADIQEAFEIPNDANDYWDWNEYYNCGTPKFHTIRAGNRWKAGDTFSPRVWSGKPYNSPQITIAPDIEIVKTWKLNVTGHAMYLNHMQIAVERNGGFYISSDRLFNLATNDGLTIRDLLDWFRFPKPFQGQVICWNPDINY